MSVDGRFGSFLGEAPLPTRKDEEVVDTLSEVAAAEVDSELRDEAEETEEADRGRRFLWSRLRRRFFCSWFDGLEALLLTTLDLMSGLEGLAGLVLERVAAEEDRERERELL